jgi:hypothetical protein
MVSVRRASIDRRSGDSKRRTQKAVVTGRFAGMMVAFLKAFYPFIQEIQESEIESGRR